jgi:hypothetical protein
VTQRAVRFCNRRAWAVWTFALLWDAGAALLAWIVATERTAGHDSWKGLLAVAVFGGAACGLTVWALNSAVTTVDVRPGLSLAITRRYPLRVRRQVLSASEVGGASVVDESDGDGGSYYVCRVELRRPPPLVLLARGRRDRAEAEAVRFNAAMHP